MKSSMHAMNAYKIASAIVTDLCKLLKVKSSSQHTGLKVTDKISVFEISVSKANLIYL